MPLSVGAAALATIGLLTVAVHKAIAAGREGIEVAHVLRSSATEAGIAYGDATEKALKFAEATNQDITSAQKQFGELARVVGSVGEVENIDKISQSLADLAAAHGTLPTDILDSVITGREAGLRAAGIFDITKRYEDFARQQGVTAAELTETEQRLVRLNAATEKGLQFAGSAKDLAATTTGQMQAVDNQLNNLTGDVGAAILANREFREGLQAINQILRLVGGSVDEVQAKLAKGITPEKIAEEQGRSWGALAADAVKAAQVQGVGDVVSLMNLAMGGERADNQLGFLARFNEIQNKRFADTTREIAAEQKLMEVQKVAAAAQAAINDQQIKSENDLAAAKISASATIKQLQTSITRDENLTSQIADIERLKKAIKEFGDTGALSAAEVKDKLAALDQQLFQTKKQIQDLVVSAFKDTGTFLDDMNQRMNKDNPFVTLVQQSETVMERMQKRFGAFGDEFVGQMAKVEQKALEMEQLAARIQSAQKVLDSEAEIRRLKFGLTGTSGEDERRLAVFAKQLAAARDIPTLEAKAAAIDRANFGRLPGTLDQDAIVRSQLSDLRKLKGQFSGTGYGEREAQSKFNEQLIAIFESATPAQQAAMLRRGEDRGEISGAYRQQAEQKRQDIEDEIRRAQAGRMRVEDAQKSLVTLSQFGGLDNDLVRKQYLSKTGELGQAEMTPAMIAGRIAALEVEKKKEAEKEQQAKEDREKLFGKDGVMNLIATQLQQGGINVNISKTGMLIEVKNTAPNAAVTGPAFDEAAGRKAMQGL